MKHDLYYEQALTRMAIELQPKLIKMITAKEIARRKAVDHVQKDDQARRDLRPNQFV